MGIRNRVRFLPLWLLVAICLAQPAQAETADPWQGVNRRIFNFNEWADARVLRPTAVAYERSVPQPLRGAVSNLFDNIATPGVALNQLLQGKPVRSLSDTGRFLVNTTLGLGGVFDVATRVGLDEHSEDFGQTFGVWGIKPGNYVMLPLLGSSNVRDSFGRLLDEDPFEDDGFGDDSDF